MRLKTTIIILLCVISVGAQTQEQVAKELQRQQVPHWEIVLAQARLETGNFTSRNCKVRHNLFGIKHNGKYTTYRRWQESITDYKKCISARYNGGDYYAFLRRIKYAKDPQYTNKLKQF